MHLESQDTFRLSKLGTEIWDMLIRSDSIEQALKIFAQHSSVDFKRIENDLGELLEQLLSRDLILLLPPGETNPDKIEMSL